MRTLPQDPIRGRLLTKLPPRQALHDELVSITLDGSTNQFSISKALLCRASEYFRKALNGEFKESSTRTLRLPGCDEPTLRLLVFYMERQALPDFLYEVYGYRAEDEEDREVGHGKFEENEYGAHPEVQTSLVRLWLLGEAYLMPKLQNQTMCRLLDFFKSDDIAAETVKLVFEETAQDSLLREVCVRQAAADCNFMPDEELDKLSSVPGLFGRVTKSLHFCTGHHIWCEHVPKCTPAARKSYEEYLVAES